MMILCRTMRARESGVKNMVYGNRLSLNNSPRRPCHCIPLSETEAYIIAAHIVRFIGTVIRELIGHGTGKMMTGTASGRFDFDHQSPPISPVTGEPLQTWFKPGDTWTSVFGKLASTVEECRAFLMSSYPADNKEIIKLFDISNKAHRPQMTVSHPILMSQ